MRYVTLTVALLLSPVAYAGDNLIGKLVSAGTSVNNFTTAAAFKATAAAPLPRWLAIQCDAAVHYATGTGSSTAAVVADNAKVAADKFWEIRLADGENALAIIPASGSATCKVFAVVF